MNQRFSITPAAAAADLELTDSVHRTLAVIGMFGDREGWCWPSQSTLADLRGVTRKTINLHIHELIERKYLNIQPRYDEETGAQKSNMMQIKFDFPPNVTGGVTSRMLQGVSPLGSYTPPNAQDVTHNAPLNATKEQIGTAVLAYENTYGPITYAASAKLTDDIDTYGETAVLNALAIAKEKQAHTYGYVEKILRNAANEKESKRAGQNLWVDEVEPYQQHRIAWADLSPIAQKAIRAIGGQSALRDAKIGYELEAIKKQVMSYAQ